MSRCRSTSFYLAPGELRYFADHTLATRGEDGNWVEFTHRNDIARYAEANPSWDGVCWVGPAGGVASLESALQAEPQRVERWRLDGRVVDGRRPEDPAGWALHRATTNGVAAAGGAAQLVGDTFPEAGRGLRAAALDAAQRGDTARMWVVSTAWRSGSLSDSDAAELLREHSPLAVRQDLAGLDENLFAAACAGLSSAQARVVCEDLLSLGPSGEPEVYVRHLRDPELLAHHIATGTTATLKAVTENPHLNIELAWNVYNRATQMVTDAQDTRELIGAHTVLTRLAYVEHLDPELLAALATSGHPGVGPTALANPNVPSAVLTAALDSTDEELLLTAMRHAPDSPELRRAVETVATPRLINELGHNTALSSESLTTLAARAGLVDHPDGNRVNSPLEPFGDRQRAVATELLAKHKATPPEVLSAIVASGNMLATPLAAANPACPTDALSAALDVALGPLISTGVTEAIMEAVGGNEAASTAALLKITEVSHSSRSLTPAARQLVDRGEVERLEQVVDLDDSQVWAGMARVEGLGDGFYEQLADTVIDTAALDHSTRVRTVGALVRNPSCSTATLDRLWSAWSQPGDIGLPAGAVAAVANHPNASDKVRAAAYVLFNRDTVPSRRVAQPARPRVSVTDELHELLDTGDRAGATRRTATTTHVDELIAVAAERPELVVSAHKKVRRLTEAAAVRTANRDLVKPVSFTGLADLPGVDDVPFSLDEDQSLVAARVEKVTVEHPTGKLELRVIPTRRALSVNANYMGNCTESYDAKIEGGESLLVAAETSDGECVYNIEVTRSYGGEWAVGELNTRFNSGITTAADNDMLVALNAAGFPYEPSRHDF